MNDELETLLRDHYRRAAEEIVPDPAVIRRAQAAPQEARASRYRRWGMPVLAAALTAAAVTVAVLLWPQPSAPPRPVERPPSIEVTPPGRSPGPSPTKAIPIPPIRPPVTGTPSGPSPHVSSSPPPIIPTPSEFPSPTTTGKPPKTPPTLTPHSPGGP